MDLRQLEVFVAVAEELNLTRAAVRSHVVQSAVSASLRTLERSVGAELFVRTTRHVELTVAGRLLLPEARRVIAAANEAEHVMQQHRGGLRGTVRLGMMQSVALAGLSTPRLIAEFGATHPGVSVTIETGGSLEHADALRRGRLDLAFVSLPKEDAHGLILRPVLTETMVLLVPAGHHLAGRREVELAELADEPFIDTKPTFGTRLSIDRAFLRAEATRTIRYELSDGLGVRDFVQHGLGVAIAPPVLAGPDLVRVPIGQHAPQFVIALATADHDLPAPVKKFLQLADHG